ncbi:MAG: hypothetical protein LBG96_15905 [Tannerella sp.]|nr:hypothetical protein [Tannerella sp.]
MKKKPLLELAFAEAFDRRQNSRNREYPLPEDAPDKMRLKPETPRLIETRLD